MPIYSRESLQKERLPWVEIDDFEFFKLGRAGAGGGHSQKPDANGHVPYWGYYQDNPPPSSYRLVPQHPKDRIMVISGSVQVESEHGRFTLNKRDFYEIPPAGATVSGAATTMTEVGRVMGHWDHAIRSEICLFEPGSPCDYHYHDGDEYWIVFKGHFTLDYHGIKVPMRPGLMMAAGMGYEHGAENPEEQFQALVMAMPLEGQKRDGHLNREMHGDPTPGREVPQSVFDELQQMADREPAGR